MVGQAGLRAALLLTVVDPAIGGILVRGEPGTGKSTAVRAMRALLPLLDVVDGCPVHCDPADQPGLCGSCRDRLAAGEALSSARRPVPLVTLPVGATEDRLLGTLDLATALRDGSRRLSPGLLATANRGFLYLDEVNLVADHLLDAMLDAASSGVHRIERDGVSAAHPARFSLIGTMNPEEGGLRPQILDRFGMSVDADVVLDPALRTLVLHRRLELTRSASARARYHAADRELAGRLVRARTRLDGVRYQPELLARVGNLVAGLSVASHRADLVLVRAAAAAAALGGQDSVSERDLALAAMLVLNHRVGDRAALLDAVSALVPDGSADSLSALLGQWGEPWQSLVGAADEPVAESLDGEAEPGGAEPAAAEPGNAGGSGAPNGRPRPGDVAPESGPVQPGGTRTPWVTAPLTAGEHGPLRAERLHAPDSAATATLVVGAHGPEGGLPAGVWPASTGQLAVVPTMVRAALRAQPAAGPVRPRMCDVVRTRRTGRPNVGLIVVLDASWSMAMDGTFGRARTFVADLLGRGKRGDRTALIVAGGSRATVAQPFARCATQAIDHVLGLRPRGRTPLVDGIAQAVAMSGRRWQYQGCATPYVLVVTDGRGGRRGEPPAERARAIATAGTLRRQRVPGSIVVVGDGEHATAERLSGLLGWRLHELAGGDA
ncbi:ATP-binding protein [Amycolatopsis sp. NPDC051061]|uniref:ATP-binding protein n=1 Tax=Amycolatopsis sp. NPDC051061 TaxID=3155042 RepID=UPI0034490691